MINLETKAKLEVLKVKIGINNKMVSEEVWKRTDSPHMHDYYADKLKEDKEEYLELLRSVLVPNKTYIMDMSNSIMAWEEDNNIVAFLQENMVVGGYKTEHEDYFYDKSTPRKIHKYCDAGRGTMNENKAEIIECLYVSEWTFMVDDEGNTIINGRPYDIYGYFTFYDENDIIFVKATKNIFDTDMIMNISLVSL